MATEQKALLARLHAKPGKEAEVAAFLKSALPLARNEDQTISWYAIQLDDATFGIFDTFADELLAQPPQIESVDVLAAK